jgi:hypothetical protein
MFHNLIQNIKVDPIGALVASANNTDNDSKTVDMAGWDGCLFIAEVALLTKGGVAALTIEGIATDATGTGTALTGAVATVTETASALYANSLLIVNVRRPQKRYLQAVRTTTTQTGTFGPCIAIRYKGDAPMPVSQTAPTAGGGYGCTVTSVYDV